MFKKNYFIFGFVALVSSSPLALMLTTVANDETPIIARILLYLAPIFIGFAASLWYLIFRKYLNKIWVFSAALSGGIIGIVTFISYALCFSLVAEILKNNEFSSAFHLIGGVGLLLFGWIPVLFGALSGWLCKKING